MYTTEDLFRPNLLGRDVRPRQNLDIHEDLLLYEYARYILHKRLVKEGLLSPYACPFYLPTEIENRKTETYQNDQHVTEQINKPTIELKVQVKEERKEKAQDIKNITKEDIALALQVDINNVKLKDVESEEWTEVKIRNQKAKAVLKENIIKPLDTLQCSNLSRYSILDDGDQDDETVLIKEKENENEFSLVS